MKKNSFYIFLLSLIFSTYPAQSASQDQDRQTNPALDQAKQDYRVFLEQLKALNSQYKQVTNEMKSVLQEEGVPTFDEETGDLTIQKPNFAKSASKPQVFGDIDIKETDKEIIVKADLPGLRKEAIKVNIQDNKLLHIEGEREEEKEIRGENNSSHYYRFERQQGHFERLIELPALVKDTGTEARYENGVLTVRIPKAETPKKEVSVSVR